MYLFREKLLVIEYRIVKNPGQRLEMFFKPKDPQTIFAQVKELFSRAYEQICVTHQKFYKQIVKYESEKQILTQKIINLSQIHEIILIQLCSNCQNVELVEIGKLTLKMHLQNMQIIKWLIKNINQLVKIPKNENGYIQDLKKRLNDKERDDKQKDKERVSYYYHVKQNSVFQAEGIEREIYKIQQRIDSDKIFQENQIRNLLSNRELVQKIEASENQQILFQAVEIFSHHSEAFKKITKQNLETNNKELNIKPYYKLKGEIEEVMKQKIGRANEKLLKTIDKYIQKKNVQSGGKKSTQQSSVSVQVNFMKQIEDKFTLEEKRRNQIIKELSLNLKVEKNRADNLQQLIRQKANYFEEKLVKVRFGKSKDSQLQILKKPIAQMTSMNNLKQDNDTQSHTDIQKNNGNLKKYGKLNINKDQKKYKFHNINSVDEQNLYQKSLMRIKFLNQQSNNEILSESKQNSSGKLSSKRILRHQICSKEVDFQYSSKYTLQSSHSIRQYRKYMKSRFSFCLNIYDYDYNPYPGQAYKNQSLLTITNMNQTLNRKMSAGQNRKNSGRVIKSTDRQPSVNSKSTHKRNRGYPFLFENENQNNTMISILHKSPFQENQPIKETIKRFSKFEDHQNILTQEPNQTRGIKQDSLFNFQSLYLKDDPYNKNKGRLHTLSAQLKKRRQLKDKFPSASKIYEAKKNLFNFGFSSVLLSVFQSEENAVQAEVQFSISASPLIADRKHHKDVQNCHKAQRLKIQEYLQTLSFDILKYLFKIKRNNPKLYSEIQYFVRCPSSYLQGQQKQGNNKEKHREEVSKQEIKNFLRFVTNLHENCKQRPCQHIKLLLDQIKIGERL